jgi:Uma2 family endonuclease
MAYTLSQTLSFEEFLTQYGDEPRYELADGEVVDMEPTGPHESVGGKLATQVGMILSTEKLPRFIPRSCLIRPSSDEATARRPDVIVLDETQLGYEPYWEREPVITLGRPLAGISKSTIKLVIEVVSTNWETDYARKLEEYASLAIPEYWIVDYRGLGGVAFIGKPKQPTFTVCQFVEEEYVQRQYRLGQTIVSPLLPSLQLRLDDVMPR